MDIQWIRKKAAEGDYELSAHAENERQMDEIPLEELEASLSQAQVLENYPHDPRGPSCLVLGYKRKGVEQNGLVR